MVGTVTDGISDIRKKHSALQDCAAELFRALDAGDAAVARGALTTLLTAIEVHVRADVALGYRLLLRHPSDAVRRIAERVLRDQEAFPKELERFIATWRDAGREAMVTPAFRDELETLVSELLKRIRVEQRLVEMLSSVA